MAQPIYSSKIFIPEIFHYEKEAYPDYKFIQTLPVGPRFGHILLGWGLYGDTYFLCLRGDDKIATAVEWGKPLGYEYRTEKEAVDWAAFYNERIINNRYYVSQETQMFRNAARKELRERMSETYYMNIHSRRKVKHITYAVSAKMMGIERADLWQLAHGQIKHPDWVVVTGESASPSE